MKNLIKLSLSVFTLVLFIGCTDDDYKIGAIAAPSNLTVSAEVVGQSDEMPDGDGSGKVNFTAQADDAMAYKFIYGDGFEEVSYDGTASHPFTKNGVNDYTITVIASGTGGVSANTTTSVTVFSDFSDPKTKQLLTGDGSRTWYIAAAEPGHLKLGPSAEPYFITSWYAAVPFEKAGEEASSCFYTDEMTFSLNENEEIIYDYNNNGATFFNNAYIEDFGGGGGDDLCLVYEAPTNLNVSLSPAGSNVSEEFSTGTSMNIASGGTIGYYVGNSSYEIMSITDSRMVIRTTSGKNPEQAWYMTLTTSQEEPEEEFVTEFENLFWEADFDTDGDLDSTVWNFEIGNNNGWGNQELQFYTADNTVISDGNLVITAKVEDIEGFNYSSSRITTKDNFEFTYGRIETRAKLPEGAGTWPAIWMLGSDFDEVGWPATGEIDIMEHKGNEQGTIHGTLHYEGRSGGDADGNTIEVEGVSSDFHIYTVEWSPDHIIFLVDGDVYHTYENNTDSPFNKDFFLILNVAMGGTFGGAIDPAFSESSMEVDYIRVYQ